MSKKNMGKYMEGERKCWKYKDIYDYIIIKVQKLKRASDLKMVSEQDLKGHVKDVTLKW